MKRPRENRFDRWPWSIVVLWALQVPAAPARARVNVGDLAALLDDSVVTTASKSAESASAAPAQIINITAEQIRAFGIRSVDEALNYLGVGIYAAHTAEVLQHVGVVTEVGARGVMFSDGGSRILVLLDGHTTNSQIDGRSWVDGALGVPIELIDHIEVMLGPGSVMYGSSAFLAVVNIFTKRARVFHGIVGTAAVILQPPQGSNGNLTAIGNGDSLGLTYRLSLGMGHEFMFLGHKAEFVAQGEWMVGQSGSFRVGPQYGPTKVLGFFNVGTGVPWQGAVSNSVSAPAVVGTLRVGDFRLGLHLNSYDRGAPLIGSLGLPGNVGNTRHFGLDLSHTASIGDHVTLNTRLYADGSQESFTQQDNSDIVSAEFTFGTSFLTERVSQWLGLEEQGVVDWLSDGRLVTSVGLDARGRHSAEIALERRDPLTLNFSQQVAGGYFDTTDALGGAYLQQVYQPFNWLGLNAGLRLDLDQLFGAHLSPRAAVVITRWKGNTIKLMYAEAFRAPTPLEVNERNVATRLLPQALQPEVVRSGELEVSQRWVSGRASLDGFLSYYESMISDRPATQAEYQAALDAHLALSSIPASGFLVLDNLGTMRGYGGSFSLEQRLPLGLSGGLNVLVSNTRMSSQTGHPQSMLFTPSWFGNARLLWQPKPDGVAVGFTVNLLGARNPYLASYNPPPAIAMGESAELRLSGTFPVPNWRGLSLRLVGDYYTNGFAPIQVGGPAALAPTQKPELVPIPRAFVMAEVRYEY